jgi:DNA-binding MarR family transcriptional regulator
MRVLLRLQRLLETAETGLSVPQCRMLAALSEGGVRSARLAERLAVRQPTVTALATGLIAAGYITREKEVGDRRIVQLQVTPAGRAELASAEAAYAARLTTVLAGYPDAERLMTGLLAVGAVLDACHHRPADAAGAETFGLPQRPGRRR